jgi:hypothetical protein
MGYLHPLGEFVDDDVEVPVPTDSSGKGSHHVHLPGSEGPSERNHLQRLNRCVDLLDGILEGSDGILEGSRLVKIVLKDITDQCTR